MYYLAFEKQLEELDARREELQALQHQPLKEGAPSAANLKTELEEIQLKSTKQLEKIYQRLTPMQILEIARHPERPSFATYTKRLFDSYTPLAGDRVNEDNLALSGGFARWGGMAVMVIGNDKGGTSPQAKAQRSFGMAMPSGYRKAIRLMELADKFELPVITLVDTPGAFPGVKAEAEGQSAAISACIETALKLKVPSVAVITGEGGSGGAVALASANRVMMLQHTIYSVISPEGCASILWRDSKKSPQAAEALKITAPELKKLKVIDKVIAEPLGGAHRSPNEAIDEVGSALRKAFEELAEEDSGNFATARRNKFLAFGNA